jgi:hypothetical protein
VVLIVAPLGGGDDWIVNLNAATEMSIELNGILYALVAGVGVLLWRSFLPAYVAEKGKNLATKEDIAAITDQVEQVRTVYAKQLQEATHQNSLLLEEIRERSQLKLVAGEKRLHAHQQAFTLWRALIATGGSADASDVCDRCLRWWEEHCLYLSPDARQALADAAWAAKLHPSLRQARPGQEGIQDLMTNWGTVTKAGDAILAGVDLPPLSSRERNVLGADNGPAAANGA